MIGLLLTANNTIATSISYVLGILVIGVIIFFIIKNYKSKNNEEKLKEFLFKIQDIVKNNIIEIIDKFDISTIKEDLPNFQAEFLESIYTNIYNLCIKELEGIDSITAAIIKKLLTKEKIEEYVLTIMDDGDIQDKLTDLFNIAIKDTIYRIEEEDLEAAKVAEEYETASEESTIPELDPTKVVDPFVEQKEEKINPPKEEESDSVEDDGTVEIIDN